MSRNDIFLQAQRAASQVVELCPEIDELVDKGQLTISDVAMRFQMELFDLVHGDKLPVDPGREC